MQLGVIGIHDALAAPRGPLQIGRGGDDGDRDHQRDGLGVLLNEGRLVAVPERPHAGMDRQKRFAAALRRSDSACQRNEVHQLAAVLEQQRVILAITSSGNVFARDQQLLHRDGRLVALRYGGPSVIGALPNDAFVQGRVLAASARRPGGLGTTLPPTASDEVEDRWVARSPHAERRVDVAIDERPVADSFPYRRELEVAR